MYLYFCMEFHRKAGSHYWWTKKAYSKMSACQMASSQVTSLLTHLILISSYLFTCNGIILSFSLKCFNFCFSCYRPSNAGNFSIFILLIYTTWGEVQLPSTAAADSILHFLLKPIFCKISGHNSRGQPKKWITLCTHNCFWQAFEHTWNVKGHYYYQY